MGIIEDWCKRHGVAIHKGNREQQPELRPAIVTSCKKCGFGTMRKSKSGRPKGYCKLYQEFTRKDNEHCASYVLREDGKVYYDKNGNMV